MLFADITTISLFRPAKLYFSYILEYPGEQVIPPTGGVLLHCQVKIHILRHAPQNVILCRYIFIK